MYLTLCLIAKDENSYLQEWLDYHILLGVEHFWIYDNESTVPLADTLASYIDRGWVTINTIKGRSMQMFAYDHCVQTYGRDSKWIGFIDTDEFIVPHTTNSLRSFLEQFEPFGGLAISSLFFGTDGNKTRPIGGQIAGYQIRTPELFSNNRLVKMIVQPEKVIYPKDPHTFLFKETFFGVNEKGRRVDAQLYPCHVDSIQVNHYFTRSAEEWSEKKKRGKVASTNAYADENYLIVNKYSSIEDTRILDRLKCTLSGAPKNPTNWAKITQRNSPNLINLLHQAAGKVNPPQFKRHESMEVFPRSEHSAYHKETELGMKLIDENKFREACELFANQISRFPFEVTRYTNFAVACIQLGDFQAAWPALAQAWRIAPQSLSVLIAMIDYYYALGDYALAEKTSLLAASQGELEPVGIAVLALSQWKQGKIQEAIATAQPVLLFMSKNKTNYPIFKELVNLIQKVK